MADVVDTLYEQSQDKELDDSDRLKNDEVNLHKYERKKTRKAKER
jgi:hypothetical protein